ncbi:MAG: hypothetical protein ACE5EC_06675, partial [Phycisphaerae bacterium]
MNPRSTSTSIPIDPAVGRLPSPVVTWPIAQLRFRRLADRWRAANLWLSLWNRDARMIACDEEAGPFW